MEGCPMRIRRISVVGALILAVPLAILARTVGAAQEQVAYFLGEVTLTTPAGQLLGNSLSLIKRILMPAEGKIVEIVASIDPAKPTREFTTIFELTGSRFVMKDAEGTFTGEGDLTGVAWEWTGWKYEVEFTGARRGRLKGEDVLGPGGLTVKKSFATPDGVVRMLFAEDLKPVSKGTYDILRAKVLSEQK
jgi:hypothetical protein